MKRRVFVPMLAALSLSASRYASAQTYTPGVTSKEILFGQTADLSASRAAITKVYSEGAKLVFDDVNRKGGIHGRLLRLVQMDDAYQTARALENADVLAHKQHVFALIHSVGTAIAEKLVPYAEQLGLPNIHPLTGADQVRSPDLPSRWTFFLRASYRKEVEKIIGQLSTLGITNIALVHEDEPFGQGIRELAESASKAKGIQLSAVGKLPFNKPTDVADAVATIRRARPAAVIVGSAGPSVENFIAAYRHSGESTQYYCLSVSNVERLHRALGKQSEGIVVTQVMPSAQGSNMPVVKQYRELVAQTKTQLTSFGLEGYISARLIVNALQEAGLQLSRERFIRALESPKLPHLGGFPIGYQSAARNGSPYVNLAMISGNGKLLQ